MTDTLYLAWRYLAFHRVKTAILVAAITLIVFLPVGLRVIVNQSSRQLTARAEATPLVIGAKGSPTELTLNTLYFSSDVPARTTYAAASEVTATDLARAIPMYVRFRVQGQPIVGTTLEYFEFRGLELAAGRQIAVLGEAVLGSRAAEMLGVGPGDYVVSSPESVFDIAGVYPLRMPVVGVLDFSDSADDDAVFVDVKTAWVIEGLGHGHQDLSRPEAAAGVLRREGNVVVGNAAVMQFNEITPDNIDSFHFHGDLSGFPLTAVVVVPPDQRSSALLQGRYQTSETNQVVSPSEVMDKLLGTILTVEKFVIAGAVTVGMATLATAFLVFALSLRLRRRERETLFKIGGSRTAVATVMASEIVAVLAVGVLSALVLTFLTQRYGDVIIRALIR
ncbi:MAG: ABC transporter permease [Gemmatimonadetes bacterium]|nr:ABC transporter permease [Gemmatimonadota bacterium]